MNPTTYLDKIIEKEIDKKNLAGANLLIMKDRKTLYRRSYGMADIEKNIPMKSDTIFRLFSMSKPVTAVAALILCERGLLDIKDPVSWYIPSFANPTVLTDGGEVPAKSEVTVANLLAMNSGLSYPENTPVGLKVCKIFDEMCRLQDEGCGTTTMELASKIGSLPLCYNPGEKWQYSSSADVLGAVIEAASGMRFSEFLEKEIFAPLGMKDTGFYVPDDKKERFAQLYRCDEKGIRPETNKNLGIEGYDKLPNFESGGAGLVSTIDDYSRFAGMLLGNGEIDGVRILSEASVRFMTSPQFEYAKIQKDQDWYSMKGYNYGSLVRILENPADYGIGCRIGEYGWDGWVGTYFIINPKDNFLMFYFVQRCDTGCNEITKRLKNIAYSMI